MSKYGMGFIRSARLTRRQLILFALISAVLNGVVTACVGTWLAQTYATQQSRRKSVEALAHLIYERRTRAGMVVLAMRRNAALDEISTVSVPTMKPMSTGTRTSCSTCSSSAKWAAS